MHDVPSDLQELWSSGQLFHWSNIEVRIKNYLQIKNRYEL